MFKFQSIKGKHAASSSLLPEGEHFDKMLNISFKNWNSFSTLFVWELKIWKKGIVSGQELKQALLRKCFIKEATLKDKRVEFTLRKKNVMLLGNSTLIYYFMSTV